MIATIAASDEDDDVILTLSDSVNYVIVGNEVQLTDAGVALVNTGADLPDFTVDANSVTSNTINPSDTIDINDALALSADQTDITFNENSAAIGDLVATLTASDEDGGNITFTLSNNTLYTIDDDNQLVLTQAGAAYVNAGNDLPSVNVTAISTDVDGFGGSTNNIEITPATTIDANDAAVIELSAIEGLELIEDSVDTNTIVATYITFDEDGDATNPVLTGDSAQYYMIDGENGNVTLSAAGVALINTGADLPTIMIEVNGGATASLTPVETTDVNDAPIANDDSEIFNSSLSGLLGNYYAYDEDNSNPNLTNLEQIILRIADEDPDATFVAQNISYSGIGDGDLAGDDNLNDNLTNLETFLGEDANSLSIGTPPEGDDAIITMEGNIELEAGTYTLRVRADDGYLIRINGEIVAIVDKNQSPTTRTHNDLSIDIENDGVYSIEIIYWDQGGQYVFEPTIQKDDGDFELLSNYPLSNDSPILNDFSITGNDSITIDPQTLFTNDTDEDGDTLSLASENPVSNAINGTVEIVDGNIVFTPTENFSGTATFDYTITDGNGGFDTATVTISVEGSGILNSEDDYLSGVISNANSPTIIDVDNISNLGRNGNGNNNSNGTRGEDTESEIIDFGIENAHATITLSFDIDFRGTWDHDVRVDSIDLLILESNGETISSLTSDGPSNSSVQYTITLDAQGQANLDFIVTSTSRSEYVNITNIEASLVNLSTTTIDVLGNDDLYEYDISLTLPTNNVIIDGNIIGQVTIITEDGRDKILFTPNEASLDLTDEQLSSITFDYTISSEGLSDTSTVTLNLSDDADAVADIIGSVDVTDGYDIQTQGSSGNDTFMISQGEAQTSAQTRIEYKFSGNDGRYSQQNSNEMVDATSGSGQSHSDTSAQVIDAGAGNDYVESAQGDDVIFAGESSSISLNQFSDRGILTDSLNSITDSDQGEYTLEDDLVEDIEDLQFDIINSGSGDDIVYGQGGTDVIYGHTGNDYLDGGEDDDGLRGGLGNDTLLGGSGDDILVGDEGNDVLIGGTGNDTIIPGLGNDVIVGGLGDDTMTSGQGSNTFLWLANELGTDTIDDFKLGEDKIDLVELLSLENDENLEQYLSFSFDNNDTTIHIDTNLDGNVTQNITLSDVDLSDNDSQTILNTLFTKIEDSEALFAETSVDNLTSNTTSLNEDDILL